MMPGNQVKGFSMGRKFLSSGVGILSLVLGGWAAAGAAIEPQGNAGGFRFGELSFVPTIIYQPGWNLARIQPVVPEQAETVFSASHPVTVAGKAAGEFSWRIQSEAPEAIKGVWDFRLSDPNINHRYLDVEIPAELADSLELVGADGKKQTLELSSKLWNKTGTVRSVEAPLNNGTTFRFKPSGELFLTVQDNRPWNRDGGFSVRFELAAGNQLGLTVERKSSAVFPVTLAGTANRSFADEVANDGKGGWTDQGPGNDMRVFDVREVNYRDLRFSIVDEKKTGKPGAIVVAGTVRNMAPAEITLPLPADLNVRGLSLLHASGWVETNQIGEVIVRYADTGTQTIPVRGGVDLGNWWVGGDFSNGKVAWSSRNPMRNVGLYASSFELGGSRPVSLTFRIVNPEAIWMIAGVTLTERPVLLPQHVARPIVAEANEQWRPIKYERRVTPGSPLGFTAIATPHKPAGKFGYPVITEAGTIAFENAPDRRLRLNGVNLCESALLLSNEDAGKLAVFLAAQGINAVRLHHHDNGLVDPNAADSTTINLKTLDRLEYLIARLKEQGIYLTFDVYTSRKLKPGDKLEVFERYPDYLSTGHTGAKNAFQFCDDAFENWKTFARNWLTHRNPYTGLTLAEDPAVILVNLSNEDTIGNGWNHTPGSISQRFLADEYAKYRAGKPGLNPSATPGNPDFMRFIYTQARKRSVEMMEFLRKELGARFLMTSANNGGDLASTWLRDVYDVVDDHIYQDHPMFPERAWGLPMAFSQSCVIAGHGWVPLNLLRGRIYGKPFYITEFDFCSPNIHRNEEGPLMGAYCALNDLDGFFRFNFSSTSWRLTNQQKRIVVFESCYDPVKQLSDRIAAALFLRGDVAPSPVKVGYTIPRSLFDRQQDYGYPALKTSGLINQIGVMFDDRPVPGVMDHRKITDRTAAELYQRYQDHKVADSVTGQIRLTPEKKTLQISTPRSAVVTLPEQGSVVDGTLKVTQSDTFQTFAAISLDGKPLAESDSIIVLQSTDMETTGVRFSDQDRRRVEATGEGPLLMRRGTAKLALPVGGERRVTAVDFQGDPLGEVPAVLENGELVFRADNCQFLDGVAGYHITKP